MRQLTPADIKGRVAREVAQRRDDDLLLFRERRQVLKAIQDALAGAEAARVVLAGVVRRTRAAEPGLRGRPLAEWPRRKKQRSGRKRPGPNGLRGQQSSAVRGASVDSGRRIRVRRYFPFCLVTLPRNVTSAASCPALPPP
jgi:hypothetical protein